MIKTTKWQRIRHRMKALGIAEKDLIEKFVLGSGRGGQKIQKTASCVYLKHIPTGTEIKCQKSREREANRYFARERLVKKIEILLLAEKSQERQAMEKIRRQKRRRKRRTQKKILEDKRHRATLKATRKNPTLDES